MFRRDTHPVHVHEVDDGDELAVEGVSGQVDQADAPKLDVALRERGDEAGMVFPSARDAAYTARDAVARREIKREEARTRS